MRRRAGAGAYDAFGLTIFRELGWKTLIFFRESGPDKSKRIMVAMGGGVTSPAARSTVYMDDPA
jgi:hypothetical protein